MGEYIKTKYANLRRYAPSGIYFIHAKVNGRLIRGSLETKSIETAKTKLAARIEKERKRPSGRIEEGCTVEDLIQAYLTRSAANLDLKERTKQYHKENIQSIRKTWPELAEMEIHTVTFEAVEEWAIKLRTMKVCRIRTGYNPTRYNAMLQTLRNIMEIAVERGLILDNPVRMANKKRGIKGISWAKVKLKEWQLPTVTQFNELLGRLKALDSRSGAAITVKLLSFSGLRIGAARRLEPKHVNLEAGWLEKPPIKYTDTVRRLPLFDELREVLATLLKEYPGTGPLMPIKDPRRALQSACRECGIALLHNHALRHLFTTRALEAGVDVRTVADWLDHKDNGALLLKRYAHVLDEHSRRMAKLVRFTSDGASEAA